MQENVSISRHDNSTVVLTDVWWRQAMDRGAKHFIDGQFELAGSAYFQAYKQIEALYHRCFDLHTHGGSAGVLKIDAPLYCLYITTCFRLAETCHHRQQYSLGLHHLENAFVLMVKESHSLQNRSRCVGCVERHYHSALNTLKEYYRFFGYSETRTEARIAELYAMALSGHYVGEEKADVG